MAATHGSPDGRCYNGTVNSGVAGDDRGPGERPGPPASCCPPISTAETLSGRPGIVDLWLFLLDDVDEPGRFRSYEALLSREERERRDRFRFERDRRLYLATRALVRTSLSRYRDVSPEEWRFAADDRGRPRLVGPELSPPIHLNLSNTAGLVACAVSVAHPRVGVDAEAKDRPAALEIAERFFAPGEVQALRALPGERQRARFFAYWTLKESYIKARGVGLSLPLERFAFLLEEGPEIGVAFEPELGDVPARWRFALLHPTPRHALAVAADTAGAPLSLRAARCVPLGREGPGPVPLRAR